MATGTMTETRKTFGERRRAVAFKVPIKELLEGKYILGKGAFAPNYVLTNLGLRISRVNLIATVTQTYISPDGKYAFIALDDGTAIIRAKAFQDTKALAKLKRGDLVMLVGKLREYNKERYIVPELVKRLADPNFETLRRLEIVRFLREWREKRKAVFEIRKQAASMEELLQKLAERGVGAEDVEAILETEQLDEERAAASNENKDVAQVRETILKVVADMDGGEGVDYSKIISAAGLPEPVVENALNELLSEGSCYEPRAGKIKVLA